MYVYKLISVLSMINFYYICAVETDSCEDCTPDELAAIIRDLRDSSGLISNHSHHLITYRNCFIGKDLVTWLVKYKGYSCELLINEALMHAFSF